MVRSSLVLCLASSLALSACASDAANGAAVPTSADLAVDQGVIFSTGEVVPGASYLKVDVIVRKHGSSNFDLKPGGTGPSDLRLMHIFKSGGVDKVYKSIDEVPDDLPSSADYGDYLGSVSTGNAFVIENNVGDGYTKVWVKQVIASAGLVRLEFKPVAP